MSVLPFLLSYLSSVFLSWSIMIRLLHEVLIPSYLWTGQLHRSAVPLSWIVAAKQTLQYTMRWEDRSQASDALIYMSRGSVKVLYVCTYIHTYGDHSVLFFHGLMLACLLACLLIPPNNIPRFQSMTKPPILAPYTYIPKGIQSIESSSLTYFIYTWLRSISAWNQSSAFLSMFLPMQKPVHPWWGLDDCR